MPFDLFFELYDKTAWVFFSGKLGNSMLMLYLCPNCCIMAKILTMGWKKCWMFVASKSDPLVIVQLVSAIFMVLAHKLGNQVLWVKRYP